MLIFSRLEFDMAYMMIIEEKERAFSKLGIQGKTRIVWYFTFSILLCKTEIFY